MWAIKFEKRISDSGNRLIQGIEDINNIKQVLKDCTFSTQLFNKCLEKYKEIPMNDHRYIEYTIPNPNNPRKYCTESLLLIRYDADRYLIDAYGNYIRKHDMLPCSIYKSIVPTVNTLAESLRHSSSYGYNMMALAFETNTWTVYAMNNQNGIKFIGYYHYKNRSWCSTIWDWSKDMSYPYNTDNIPKTLREKLIKVKDKYLYG